MSTMSIEHATLTAPDISCGHCVATIKQTLGTLPGISTVDANETTKRVDVGFDPNQVSLTQIEAALDEAGYPVQG
jgi:copper ion binding protein